MRYETRTASAMSRIMRRMTPMAIPEGVDNTGKEEEERVMKWKMRRRRRREGG